MSNATNPCVRCGKLRVVTSSSVEVINGAKIVSETTSCPDPECQKKVVVKLEHDRVERQRAMEMNVKKNDRNNGKNSFYLGKKKAE
jgi:uncharacterized protein (UPF0179 family)